MQLSLKENCFLAMNFLVAKYINSLLNGVCNKNIYIANIISIKASLSWLAMKYLTAIGNVSDDIFVCCKRVVAKVSVSYEIIVDQFVANQEVSDEYLQTFHCKGKRL